MENFNELKKLIMEFVKSKAGIGSEKYKEIDVGSKILNELVKIRKILGKLSRED